MCIHYAYYCRCHCIHRERWALVQEEKQLLKDLEVKADDAKDTRLGEYYMCILIRAYILYTCYSYLYIHLSFLCALYSCRITL